MLKINNAFKKFGEIVILNNISIDIKENSITGLAGPSGGGKSTLLRCIQGLDSLDSGSIEYKGSSSFMFQDFQLFPHMNVMENLVYATKFHNITRNEADKRAIDILESLGLSDKNNHYPHQLSGGQKQRIALGRCLMLNPSLLLCDEPTSGLDVATIDDVISLLNSVKSMGVTMIIASHDLDFLTKIADRIILLKNGLISNDVLSGNYNINELKEYYTLG